MKHVSTVAATLALCVSLGTAALAQAPAPSPQSASMTATMTAKIIAIDQQQRVVTLQDAKGNTQQIQVGPNVTRFDALKVGDTVTFQYQQSLALSISKPGTAAPAPAGTPTVTRAAGDKPGGTISQTVTATVTIQAIDQTTPSVTVKTQDGRIVTLLVQNKANLAGVNVGDVVQITYTQALMITVQ